MAVFHYSRVSTNKQFVENQQITVNNSMFAIDHYYSDTGVSGGVDALDRDQFSEMVSKMVSGDVLVITDVSRLGRNTIDVLTTVKKFKEMGVSVCALNYGSTDLTSDVGQFILTMAAGFAELERADLKRKTRAGLIRTKESGTKLGQPLKITPETLEAIVSDKKDGMTLDKMAAKHSIVKSTLHANLIKWGDNLSGYRDEFNVRQAQYALKAQQ